MLPALSSANTLHAPHLDTSGNSSASQHSATKRGTSMIFRIEHLLPPTMTTTTTGSMAGASPPASLLAARAPAAHSSTGRRERESQSSAHRRSKQARTSTGCGSSAGHDHGHGHSHGSTSGVYVAQFTPKDTASESVATIALMSANCYADAEQTAPSARAYCSLAAEGALVMTPALLRRIKLSEDIHSYNAIFELQGGQDVRVRIVRDVDADEEIVAWFGEEVNLLMAIPFLTPLNIQGNKRYTCHLCHLTFETPNPLKVHLALGCGRHSMDILWMRLHYAVKATTFTRQQQQQQHLQPPYAPPLPPAPLRYASSAQHSPATVASTASSVSPTTTPPPPPTMPTLTVQRFSAFKPITSSASGHAAQPLATSISMSLGHVSQQHSHNTTTSTASMSFLPSISSATLPTMSMLQSAPSNGPLNAAAQIEAIVSNMGASKQGHLCIYCGKVYSRKYGLKIHIRTHTGFKPLKCKFCLRPFGDPSNLNKHVRLHLQTNAASSSGTAEGYRCHLCHKTLARRRDLQRHIESRHAISGATDKDNSR